MINNTIHGQLIDLARTPAIPGRRLVRAEFRKMSGTRAGRWLLMAVAASSVLAAGGYAVRDAGDPPGFAGLVASATSPQSLLWPLLGILAVTQEWSQRTAAITFTQVPARGRVLLAKLLAAAGYVLAVFAITVLAAAALAPATGSAPWRGVTAGLIARVLLALLIGLASGLALGAALLNSAFAIAAYFLIPIALTMASGAWAGGGRLIVWVQLNSALLPLHHPRVTGLEWAHLGTSALAWVALPGVIGIRRVLGSDIR